MVVGNGNAVPVSGTTCAELEELGQTGFLPPSMCKSLLSSTKPRCGCEPIAESHGPGKGFEPSCNLCNKQGHAIVVEGEPTPDTLDGCFSLMHIGKEDSVPEGLCVELQQYAAALDCPCKPVTAEFFEESDVTSSPTAAPTSSPATVDNFLYGHPYCNVCGEGSSISNANGTPMPRTTCAFLQARGNAGRIPETICSGLRTLTKEPCGCKSVGTGGGDQTFSEDSCVELTADCSTGSFCCDSRAVCDGVCFFPKETLESKDESKLSFLGKKRDRRASTKGNSGN